MDVNAHSQSNTMDSVPIGYCHRNGNTCGNGSGHCESFTITLSKPNGNVFTHATIHTDDSGTTNAHSDNSIDPDADSTTSYRHTDTHRHAIVH
jgi:hypothetical protein